MYCGNGEYNSLSVHSSLQYNLIVLLFLHNHQIVHTWKPIIFVNDIFKLEVCRIGDNRGPDKASLLQGNNNSYQMLA